MSLPADTGGDSPRMEIEFEVVSVYRPRLVRVAAGDGQGAAQEYRIADEPFDDDEPAARGDPSGHPEDESLGTIVLWAYFEACRQDARGPEEVPWHRPRPAETWRAFQEAVRNAPDRHAWWSDPERRLQRFRAIYHGLSAPDASGHAGGRQAARTSTRTSDRADAGRPASAHPAPAAFRQFYLVVPRSGGSAAARGGPSRTSGPGPRHR